MRSWFQFVRGPNMAILDNSSIQLNTFSVASAHRQFKDNIYEHLVAMEQILRVNRGREANLP